MASVSHVRLADGSGGVSSSLAPIKRTHLEHSTGRATVLVGLFLSMSLGGGVALLGESPLGALLVFLALPIMVGVLCVAWMRPPSGSPEHHPRIDRLLDDTSP
ncbi:MAG TPA: hypothetical protein VMI54_02070 [Polyangiaceae bacterium]|nr:hypothetical protein [Polyangiaceae bacterium]